MPHPGGAWRSSRSVLKAPIAAELDLMPKRLAQRKKPGNSRAAGNGPSKSDQQGALALVSMYRKRIEELANSIAVFREHTRKMNVSLAQLSQERAHFSEFFENAPSAYIVHDGRGY